jgi:maltose alpha-D-glucosyltransferase/alpha-amylase
MELGLSGFRVDAVPFLVEQVTGDQGDQLPDPHEFFADMRAFMNRRDGSAALLGEVNLPYPDLLKYFGDGLGNELTLCFDFIGMQRMYLSLARGEAAPLAGALRERPVPPKDCHWATFARNHDELTLDKLTDGERREVFDAFGPEKDMQVFGRGIRRRLPTMLGGDMRKIKMAYSLMFSLPGTPVLFYGEEIGMGENLEIEGRQAVRTPMQWTPNLNGGFSTADPSRFRNPMPGGEYAPEHVNVGAQLRDPDSLLQWIMRLIETYRECPELAWGHYQVLDCHDAVLAHRCDIDGGVVLAVHNFGDEGQEVVLTMEGLDDSHVLTDLLVDGTVQIDADGRARVEIGSYGCRWFRASEPELAPAETADAG